VSRLLIVSFALLSFAPCAALAVTFTEAAVGLECNGDKYGGVAWADFDADGCLDLLVNRRLAGDSGRLYRNDCQLPDPQFDDVTATHAAGIATLTIDRAVIWGDVNGDGFVDFARSGTDDLVQIFLNRGPTASPAYSFGDAGQVPDFELLWLAGGLNPEGLAWIDYDNDGWLDLMIENGEAGIDILRNPADGTAEMIHATTDHDPLGLPTATGNGDFCAAADLDVDGDVDWVSRREGVWPDLYLNDGGTFVAGGDLGDAVNADKGGAVFCDLDADGDFDLLWTAPDVTEIWQQDGVGSGVFGATGVPAVSDCNADGVDCGDVDNDGDLDLLLSCDTHDQLWLNDGVAGTLSFTRDDSGITGDADGEAAVFVDYDNDGDLDLYVSQGGDSVLWRNDANDGGEDAYLLVEPRRDLGGGFSRADIGATVQLLDYQGNLLGPVQEVNGGKGHGSQKTPRLHFGLGAIGVDQPVVVHVGFVTGEEVDLAVLPGDLPGDHQVALVLNTDVPDSDGDGIPDGHELLDGTDPLDADDPPVGDDDTGDDDTGDDDASDDDTGDDDTGDDDTGDDDAGDDDAGIDIGPTDDDDISTGGCQCGLDTASAARPALLVVVALAGIAARRRRS
jgi:MYXO-CTERM domain-containing protein